MLPTIENSQRFKSEFNDWKSRSDKITNPKLKKEVNDLLTELLRTVRELDTQHLDVLMSKQISNIVSEKRLKISELRQTIHKLLTSYEKTLDSVKN